MRNYGQERTVLTGWAAVLILVLAASGCSYLNENSKSSGSVEKGTSPKYYDFGDILVPDELEVDKDESFIVKTPTFSAGVLILKGRVERNSLISFFESNMTKDNWQVVSSFKSPRTMMLFRKENRWCVINITDRNLKYHTSVEVWVAPHIGDLKPLVIEESVMSN